MTQGINRRPKTKSEPTHGSDHVWHFKTARRTRQWPHVNVKNSQSTQRALVLTCGHCPVRRKWRETRCDIVKNKVLGSVRLLFLPRGVLMIMVAINGYQ